MAKNKRRSLKVILIVFVILAAGGFALNYFLANRLQSFLRRELSMRVNQASDGFYQMNFDNLGIGLFNGELTITGIVLKPDSTIFNQWAANDSLPSTYFDIRVDTIHFKGLNLIWMINYRELNFSLFEIKKPVINIYDSNSSAKISNNTKNTIGKTPYEMISGYISLITVKDMNLEYANFSYYSKDTGDNSIYSLQNVSFHAHGFRLDENSYEKGKLLYSDNFDFITYQPQTLLSNNQFTLNADVIKLDTRDSIIQINNISLIPQKMLWAQTNQFPDSYIDASIDSIQVKGFDFKRREATDYLEVRSFDILTPDIKYFETKVDSLKRDRLQMVGKDSLKNVTSQKTIDLSWSLYTIVSPIFKSLTIENIGIKNAKLAYSVKSDDKTDLYKMEKFNFNAYDFSLDSLADIHKKFLYSEYFDIHATDIYATLATKNHVLSIGDMFMSTLNSVFEVKTIKLWPLERNTDLDYMQGSIDSLAILGMKYDRDSLGLDIDAFLINHPVVEYVKVPDKVVNHIKIGKTDPLSESTTPLKMLSPVVKFLSINDFNINQGDLIFRDKRKFKDEMVYKLPRFDFHVKNILLNKESIIESDIYMYYSDFNFSFENFNNLLPGRQYRLSIGRGYYTGSGGDLSLRQVQLIPQKQTWRQSSGTYFSLVAPTIDLKNISYNQFNNENVLRLGSVNLLSPKLNITKVHNSLSVKKDIDLKNLVIDLGNINIVKGNLKYLDEITQDSVDFLVNKLSLSSVVWDSQKKLKINTLAIQDPTIYIKEKQKAKSFVDSMTNSTKPFDENLSLRDIHIQNLKMNLEKPDLKLVANVESFNIRQLSSVYGSLKVASINILKPILKLEEEASTRNVTVEKSRSKDSENLYITLGRFSKHLSLGKFDMIDAELDYNSVVKGRSNVQQKVNSTAFNLTGLELDVESQKLDILDFNLNTKNIRFPLSKGLYTFQIGELDIHKKNRLLKLNGLHLIPSYSKEQFAYHSPKHSDWFDISVGSIVMDDIDYPIYFSDKILNIRDLQVNDVKLLNYKNQNIEIEHHPMPLIYEGLQKAPLKMNINNLEVNNFMVNYQELSKGASVPGEIFFTDMNGKFEGFTNIVSKPQQYIKLDADGKLMGTGQFTATWYIPVDSLNDRFLLIGRLGQFDLSDLNRLVTPMAPVEVRDGIVKSLVFKTEASSLGANVQMRFLYNDLDVNVLKNTDGSMSPNKLFSGLANAVLKRNNPDKRNKKPREPYLSIVRAPDHSTFNYLWQILQPPVLESVGISQRKQNLMKDVSSFISKVKGFFKKNKKQKSESEK